MQRRPKASERGPGNWDDLRFFLAVARGGGLSAAARVLRVNQSTVLRRIAKLEEQLGARLFDRGARGYALTAVGETMLGRAAVVEDEVLALGRAVSGADHEHRGVIRVTTVDELLERVAPHLRIFCERYPRIELRISTEQRPLSLTRRETDVALRPGIRPTEPDVVGRRLVALPSAAYCSPSYLEGRSRPRRFSELRSHVHLSFPPEHPAARLLHERLPDARVVCRVDSMRALAIAASAGLGVAVLPTFMGEHVPGLQRLFVVRLPEEVHLWLLIHADLRQSARVRAFVDFMTEVLLDDAEAYGASRRSR